MRRAAIEYFSCAEKWFWKFHKKFVFDPKVSTLCSCFWIRWLWLDIKIYILQNNYCIIKFSWLRGWQKEERFIQKAFNCKLFARKTNVLLCLGSALSLQTPFEDRRVKKLWYVANWNPIVSTCSFERACVAQSEECSSYIEWSRVN